MEAGIESVVRDYVEGMVFADEERLRRAFHPLATVIGLEGETEEAVPIEEFISAVRSAGSADRNAVPHWKVELFNRPGDMAMVRVEDDYLGTRYVDYLALLRLSGRWVITSKTFRSQGRV